MRAKRKCTRLDSVVGYDDPQISKSHYFGGRSADVKAKSFEFYCAAFRDGKALQWSPEGRMKSNHRPKNPGEQADQRQ